LLLQLILKICFPFARSHEELDDDLLKPIRDQLGPQHGGRGPEKVPRHPHHHVRVGAALCYRGRYPHDPARLPAVRMLALLKRDQPEAVLWALRK
jgi:hypothetical protein